MSIRIVKAVTDEDIEKAVHMARAVIRLDDRTRRLAEEKARLEEQLDTFRQSSVRAEQERMRLLGQIWAVEHLHLPDDQGAQGGREATNALRRILDRHIASETAEIEGRTGTVTWCPVCGNVAFPCDTVRDLAAVYADRPGWREEWALEGNGKG